MIRSLTVFILLNTLLILNSFAFQKNLDQTNNGIINEWKLDCWAERFSERGADQLGYNSATKRFQNVPRLFFNLSQNQFPAKSHLGCIRDQFKRRNSCVAFGTTAIAEIKASELTGKHTNYSEQAFYSKALMKWKSYNPNDIFFNDSLVQQDILKLAGEQNYKFSPGNFWIYNPSTQRIRNQQTLTYTNSCSGYSPQMGATFCSEFNHQLPLIACPNNQLKCYPDIPIWKHEPINDYVVQLNGSAYLSFNDSVERSPELNAFSADPVQALIEIYEAKGSLLGVGGFDMPPQNNFNPSALAPIADENSENQLSGHTAAVVGLILNNNLPINFPPGDGGGYIIFKNSSGETYADQGLSLMSFSYLRRRLQGISFLGLKMKSGFTPPGPNRECEIKCYNKISDKTVYELKSANSIQLANVDLCLERLKYFYNSIHHEQIDERSYCEGNWGIHRIKTIVKTKNHLNQIELLKNEKLKSGFAKVLSLRKY